MFGTGMKSLTNSPRLVLTATIMTAVVQVQVAMANPLDDCLDAKVREFEAANPFSHTASVTCPAADIVGIIPKERKHDRSTTVRYVPPPNFSIRVDAARGIPRVVDVSKVAGRIGSPNINEAQVTVGISCSGRPLGKGRAWQEVKIEGEIYRRATIDQLKGWLLQCARAN